MAAGDINSREIGSAGEFCLISGELEADQTARTFAIADEGTRIVLAEVQIISDVPEEAPQVVINSDDGTAETKNGSLRITGKAADFGGGDNNDTYAYRVYCQGPF